MGNFVSAEYFEEPFISRLSREIEEVGYAIIPDFFSNESLKHAVGDVHKEIELHGSEYFSLRWQQYHPDSILREIRADESFRELLRLILDRAGARPSADQEIHSVLRVSMGKRSQLGVNKFHFDAYNLTALMSIVYPDEQVPNKGELVVFPNLRGFGRSSVVNFFWKTALQNPIMRSAFAALAVGSTRSKTVPVRPGDLCLFFGYRTYHGNTAIDPEATRATALFHFDDPHADSRIVRMIEERRKPPQKRG